MGEVSIIGIDLAKRSCQLHGAREDGSVAFRKKLSREKLLDFLASQPRCVVAMEVLFPGISQRKQGLLYRTIPVTDFSGQGLIRYGPVGFFSKQTVSKQAASVEACSM